MSVLAAFLKLDGLPVVLVGGGKIATQKARALIGAGAVVTVVSPALEPELAGLGVRWVPRAFAPEDLDGARLVVAATDDPDVARAVEAAAQARGIFVNAVDQPERSSFYFGAVLERGRVKVAVSTEGASPTLAGRIRDAIDALVDPAYAEAAEVLAAARAEVQARLPGPYERRRRFYAQLLDDGFVDLVRRAGAAEGRALLARRLDEAG